MALYAACVALFMGFELLLGAHGIVHGVAIGAGDAAPLFATVLARRKTGGRRQRLVLAAGHAEAPGAIEEILGADVRVRFRGRRAEQEPRAVQGIAGDFATAVTVRKPAIFVFWKRE